MGDVGAVVVGARFVDGVNGVDGWRKNVGYPAVV
jgi:hypothetical protein